MNSFKTHEAEDQTDPGPCVAATRGLPGQPADLFHSHLSAFLTQGKPPLAPAFQRLEKKQTLGYVCVCWGVGVDSLAA